MSVADKLAGKIIDGYRLDYHEAVELMNDTPKAELYDLAHRLRTHFQGRRIDTCSIMNARSGRCSEDCKWCAQSAFHKTDVEIYPLVGLNAALAEARHNASKGVKRFSLVTSGRTLTAPETAAVCDIYSSIRSQVGIGLCASMGLLSKEQLVELRRSGVENYHCNLETAPSYFPELCTTHTIEQKLRTIGWAKEAGLKICSGGIIGMGESAEQRVEFAFALSDIGVVSIPVNVLNPIPGTPLENMEPLSDDDLLTAFAMMRIVNPEADIRFAGGRSVFRHIQKDALHSGVSASIVGDMLTTLGSDIDADKEMFRKCGFEF